MQVRTISDVIVGFVVTPGAIQGPRPLLLRQDRNALRLAMENPRTQWRFLSEKITDFYGPVSSHG